MVCDPALLGRLWVMVLLAEDAGGAAASVPADSPAAAMPAAPRRKATQLSLFGSNVTGRFEGVEPTIMDSENLDKPTFIRRGLPIQKLRDAAS